MAKRNRFSNAQQSIVPVGATASEDEDNYSDDDFEVQVDSAIV